MTTSIMLTVPDAVSASGMSRSALYEALRRGDLMARKAGRRTLIARTDLEAFLANLPAYNGEA